MSATVTVLLKEQPGGKARTVSIPLGSERAAFRAELLRRIATPGARFLSIEAPNVRFLDLSKPVGAAALAVPNFYVTGDPPQTTSSDKRLLLSRCFFKMDVTARKLPEGCACPLRESGSLCREGAF